MCGSWGLVSDFVVYAPGEIVCILVYLHVGMLRRGVGWAASTIGLLLGWQIVRAGALPHCGSGSLPAVTGSRCLPRLWLCFPFPASSWNALPCLLQRAPHIATGLPREAGVKTKTQLNSERNVLRQLLASILGASASEDLKEAAQPFARHVSRHFAMLVAAGASAPNKQRGQVSTNEFYCKFWHISWMCSRPLVWLSMYACCLLRCPSALSSQVALRGQHCPDGPPLMLLGPPPLATGCMCPSSGWAALLIHC